MTATNERIPIPDRSRPGITIVFPVGHKGGIDKCATGAKLRGKEDITIAIWNGRTLRAADKVEEVLHEMDRYKWSLEKSQRMGVTDCILVIREQTRTRSGCPSA